MPEHDDEIDDPIPTPVEFDLFGPGVSQAEAQRALLVRAGFMAALLTDARVLRRLSHWLIRVREYAEREVAGTAPPGLDVIGEEGVRFVRDELGLRWPWVWGDLIETMHGMGNLGISDPVKAAPPPGTAAILSPPFMIEVKDGDGVSTDEAMAELLRVMHVVQDAEAAVKAERRSQSPRGGGEHLRTWGKWFYEARVRRPVKSVRALAAQYHQDAGHHGPPKDHDDRKHVGEAIEEAQRLLSLGAYTF